MMGSRKFKWLRDRLGASSATPYSSLMQQIKQFILGEKDVRAMEIALSRQVTRAELRFAGICSLIELLNCCPMLPSVKYSALCGWMSLLRPTRYGHCLIPCSCNHSTLFSHPLTNCLSNVEHAPSYLLVQLEQEYWLLTNHTLHGLRSSLWEASQALRHARGASISNFTVSRFIFLYAGMLTTMQIPTSLAFLVNDGALGLTQTMLRLTDPLTMEEEDTASVGAKEGSNVLAPEAVGTQDQPQPAAAATTTSPQPATGTLEEPPTGAALVRRISVGVRVIRGPDWKWGDQVP